MHGREQFRKHLADLAGPLVRAGYGAQLDRAAQALSADETPLRVVLAHINGEERPLRERQRVVVASDRRLMLIPMASDEVVTVPYSEIREVSGRRMFLAGRLRDVATLGSFFGRLAP